MFSSGRASRLPHIDPNTKLFKEVFPAIYDRFKEKLQLALAKKGT
jgi:hypothetical protein